MICDAPSSASNAPGASLAMAGAGAYHLWQAAPGERLLALLQEFGVEALMGGRYPLVGRPELV